MNVAQSNRPARDSDWLTRCRAGDEQAWRDLYDRYLPLVYRVALRMGASDRELADVCQEVFLRIHRGLAGFREDAQFSTWCYRITVNEVSRLRRDAGLRRTLSALLGREPEPPPVPQPDRGAERNQALRELLDVLARMKPKKRTVFVLHELEELSTEEIASVLEVPVDTAKSRLRLAREEFERVRRQRNLVVIPGGKR